MDVHQRDIEFQNEAKTLRVAPWLDMPKLRLAAQKSLTLMVENDTFRWSYKEFLEDIMKFCNGECSIMPRAGNTIDALGNVLANTFPAYRADTRKARSFGHISRYIVQEMQWNTARRLPAEEEEEESEDLPF
jgi:hypothetical protein